MKVLNYLILLMISAGFMFATAANSDVYLSQNDEEAPAAEPVEEEAPAAEPVEEEAPAAEPTEEEAPAAEPTEEEAPAAEPTEEEAPAAEPTEEEAPAAEPTEEEAPAAEPTEEEAPAEEETQTPVNFKEEFTVSVNVGPSMPIGTNLKNQFSSGLNFQLDVATPFVFSGIQVIGHLSMFSLGTIGDNSQNYTDYSVTSVGVKFAKKVSMLDVTLGTGLSLASGTAMYNPYDNYDMTTFFLSGAVSYTLPLSGVIEKIGVKQLNDLEVSVSIGGMEIFGAPSDSGTSDLLNFGASFSYPVFF